MKKKIKHYPMTGRLIVTWGQFREVGDKHRFWHSESWEANNNSISVIPKVRRTVAKVW